MRIVIVLLVLLLCTPANAQHIHSSHGRVKASEAGIIAVDTAAGVIRVAADYATKFKNMIADFVAAGYHPGHVGCFASSGHVRHSRHYLGQACDFDQGGRPHSAFMRTKEADRIISKYGFTNGCSFSDCGHVGTDGHRSHYASASHRRHRHAHYHYHHHHRHAKIASRPWKSARGLTWNDPTG